MGHAGVTAVGAVARLTAICAALAAVATLGGCGGGQVGVTTTVSCDAVFDALGSRPARVREASCGSHSWTGESLRAEFVGDNDDVDRWVDEVLPGAAFWSDCAGAHVTACATDGRTLASGEEATVSVDLSPRPDGTTTAVALRISTF